MASTQPPSSKRSIRSYALVGVAFILGAVVMAGIGALLVNIEKRKMEAALSPAQIAPIPEDTIDPAVWGRNFPRQYDAFMKTKDDTLSTPYGGSVPYSKLERNPEKKRIWAGNPFSKDYNEERGHYYGLIDQKQTKRMSDKQPGACANCHAAEAPVLIKQMGWEAFNKGPYYVISDSLHLGTSCNDCHDAQTMELRISRPAFLNAMQARGIDVSQATRQEMRSYVCAQCHVEYYFLGDNKILTFPWEKGLNVDQINEYYDEYGFRDWVHAETGAPMIKIQHPEFELYSTGLHAASGVACADCHMPYVREGSVKVSDHWLRSPLTNLNNACQTCHKQSEADLRDRVLTIQNRTAGLLHSAEAALIDAIDAIKAAQEAGATDAELEAARQLHRKASLRWDFVASENSTGFHSPQEAARILADAINYARQAQLEAERLSRQIRSGAGSGTTIR
ncbi:MAG: ammonia-forming cytochrome c nitrite reductase subunit c552 [Anaerolineae bacterium]|nr:ammonia-forming cytochrome c nitrite reductase subunit c552 [Thermoflexales bacterium]MDW8407648.1 ammonia-forming cytochrome c nitrite reductase subunit c552 [Anaerolineae bacterium]